MPLDRFATEASKISEESSRQAVIPLTTLGFWFYDLSSVYNTITLDRDLEIGDPEAIALRKTLRTMTWWATALLGSLGVSDPAAALVAEYGRSSVKHPGMTLDADGHTDETRFYALAEEVGEVAAALTYDNTDGTGHNADLISEVTQVGALALAWATRYLEDEEEEEGNE